MLATEVFYVALQQQWAWKQVHIHGVARCLSLGCLIRLMRDQFWMALASIGLLCFGSWNQLILRHYSDAKELGGYAAAWQVVLMVMLLLAQVARIGKPKIARITSMNTPV